MTTLENIVNPLPFVLAAWNRILESAGHKVWTVTAFDEPGDDETKLAPFIETQLTNLRAAGGQYPLDGDTYWSTWSAELISRASTRRPNNVDKHIAMVGGIYVLAARASKLFSPAVLPYHRILQLKPSGQTSAVAGLLDQTEVHLEVVIGVRDDAWPDS